jgi:hypothetical protein
VELDLAVAVERAQPYRTGAVTEGVVDEVAEGLLEAEPVALEDDGRSVGLDRPAAFLRARAERLSHRGQQVTGPDVVSAKAEAPVVGLSEDEEIFREPHKPVRLGGRGPERLLQLPSRPRLAQRQLELGLQEREWRAELVARVGDEAALACERALEAVEHRVQRL